MSAFLEALINSAIVSTLVTTAVWLGMRAASRRLNAATKYLVWWTVLAITVFLPLWYLHEGLIPRTPADPAHPELPPQVVRMPSVPHEIQGAERWAPQVIANPRVPVRSPRLPFRVTAGSVPTWAGVVWAITSVVMLFRLAISWVVLRRRRARATEALPSLSARLDHWLRQCGSSRRTLRIGVSAEIAIPMVAGLRHPSLLLPAGLLGDLDETELDQIAIHEAAHVARGDDRALVIQRIIEALFPLHPVVRWLARRIDLEREIACDDFVVLAFGSPRPYAACLLRVAELTSRVRGSVIAAAVVDERSHLTRRVNMLLDKSRHSGTRTLKVPLAVVVAAILGVTRITAHTPGPIVFALPKASAFPLAVPVALPAHGQPPWLAPLAPPAGVVPPAGPTSPLPGAVNLAPSPPPIPAKPPASPQGTADVMTIQVAVRDPMNRFVTGLDKANFRLFEDGVEQKVTLVRTGDAPVYLGLGVIGTSGKVGTEHTQIEAAFRQFFEQFSSMNPMFPIYVIEPEWYMGSQPGLAFDIIDRSMSTRLMRKAPNSRKVMLVVADSVSGQSNTVGRDPFDGGQPARQLVEEQRVIAEYAEENVLVYALDIVGDNESPSRFLTELTTETGGHLFTANVDNIAATAMQIRAEVQNLYGLEYTPTNTTHEGAYRAVKVELVEPRGLPPLKLEYRPGYHESRR